MMSFEIQFYTVTNQQFWEPNSEAYSSPFRTLHWFSSTSTFHAGNIEYFVISKTHSTKYWQMKYYLYRLFL
jgi:hypothetical protein